MSKTIGIVIFDDVLTAEVIGPAEVFGMASHHDWFAGGQVLLIGIENQPTVQSAEGITLTVDRTIADEVALDVLIVPGAYDVNHLLKHTALNTFIKKQDQSVQWIGSVCAGAFILGNAGVLDGKQATTWFGGEDSLQEQFPAINVVHDQPVVVDDRRVTANGGLAGYQAALILLGKLTSAEHAHEIYQSLSMGRLDDWATIAATINLAEAPA